MPTSVALTPHFQTMIQRLVAKGRYNNVSEVVRDGLRLLEDQMAEEAAKIEALRHAARVGFRDLDEGRFDVVPVDEIGAYISAAGKRAVARRQR